MLHFIKNKIAPKKIWLLGIVYLTFVCIHILRSSYDNDELEHLHASWLVSVGKIPFTDFVEQHNPLLWYLLAPFMQFFQESITWAVATVRFFDLGLLIISAVALWRLFRLFYNNRVSFWLMLLLMANVMFVHHMIEFRPDPLMSTLLFCSFTTWAEYFVKQKPYTIAYSGLFLGLAVVVLQKALVFWLMMVGMFGWAFVLAPYWGWKRPFIAKALLLFVAMSLIPIFLSLLWVNQVMSFADYWFWNFPFNQFFYLKAHVFHHFPWYEKVGQNLMECFVAWPLGIIGLACVIKWHKKNFALISFAAMVFAYFLGFMRSRFPLAQYLIPFFPLLALMAGTFLSRLETRFPKWFFTTTVLISLTLLECGIIMLNYSENKEQIAGIEFILQNTTVSDTVFAQPPLNPVFRHDASYFWYNNGPIQNALQDYEKEFGTITTWQEKDKAQWFSNPPKFVRYDPERDYKFLPRTKDWFRDYIPLNHHGIMQRPEAYLP